MAAALVVAEAQIDLARVRQTKRDLIAPAFLWSGYSPRKPHARLPSRKDMELMQGRPTAEKLAFVIADASEDLRLIDRYQRRALSRRKFAIRNLDVVLAKRQSESQARPDDDGGRG